LLEYEIAKRGFVLIRTENSASDEIFADNKVRTRKEIVLES
jgi:hypothetical protein